MVSYAKNKWLLMETPPTMPQDLTYNHSLAKAIIDRALETECHLLTETESKAMLSAYGIPVNPTETATTPESAATIAASLGFPVALKVLSRVISHKTEVDGVRLNLNDEGEVQRAYEEIMGSVQKEMPQAQIDGVTVQTMVENPDHELIVGASFDRGFGPILLFGAGGVAANFLEDRAVELPPLNRLLARRFMEKTRIYKLLEGVRGMAPANVSRIEEILIRLSLLVTDFPEIWELDINPLVVKGDTIMAVDARVVVAPKKVAAPLHLSISPYPNQYESNWVMGDGTPVLLRPVRPEDEPLMKELLESLSGRSSYLRFFKTLRDFSHEWLAHITQIDYDRELAMVAITQPPFQERILGESRLVHELTGDAAEFAIIVGDRWQGKGLGRKLLELLIDIARERGIQRVKGFIMPENINMIKLCEKLGFIKSHDRDLGTFIVEIEL
jgi:acetyltransferase